MADRKITALTELTAPVATDVFPIIDVSESANANKNKKIQLTTILRGIPNGSASAPSVGFIDDTGTTGLFRVTDDEIGISCNQTQIASFATTGLKLGTGTAAAQLHLFSTDTTDQVIIENTDAGADTAPDLVLFRNSASPADNDNLANLVFRGQDDNGDAVEYATIAAQIADASNGSEDGILDLMSTAAGTLASRIRLKSEFVGIHESDPTFPLHLATADTTAGFCIESNLNSSGSSADILLFHRRGDSGAGQDNDVLSTITFQGKNDGANETDTVPAGVEYAAIEAVIVDASDDTEDGKLNLEVMVAGTLTSVLAIDSNGATIVGSIVVSGTVDGVDIAARDTLFGGLTSSSGVLTNGVTATTQSASDNSTKVATTAYTDTAISNLIDSSPSTLNTLNELAAALGDDANFSTTVTNSIATKLPLAGGTLTGNVTHNDNVKAIFGTGGDLELYHDSNNSVIDSNTGDFYISSAGAFIFQTNNNENSIKCVANGAVELYFDALKRLETKSWGSHVFGALVANGDLKANTYTGRLKIGENDEFTIQHDDTDTFIENTAGNLHIRPKASEEGIKLIPDGNIEMYHDNVKKAEVVSNGLNVEGTVTCDDILLANTIKHEGQTNTKIEFDGTQIKLFSNAVERLNISQFGAFLGTGYKLLFTSVSGESPFIRSFGTTNGDIQIGVGTDSMAQFKRDGAVELYHDNIKRLETASNGAACHGRLTMHGDIVAADNHAIKLGTGLDLIVVHDGSDSKITNKTGNLLIEAKDSETGIKVIPDAAVELYHDNALKFTTKSFGATAFGTLTANGGDIKTINSTSSTDTNSFLLANSTGNALQVIHTSSNSYIKNLVGSLFIEPKSGETGIKVIPDGAVELYYDNVKRFNTTADAVDVHGHLNLGANTDDKRLRFGINNDLQLYHDATDSHILNSTGILNINSTSGIKVHGSVEPEADNTRALGSSSKRFTTLHSAALNTGDINMSNLNDSGNEVDGSKGSWTLQEGADDLFIINRVSGKKYKFNLTEIS